MTYEEQRSSQAGKDLRAGLLHVYPDLKDELPVSARALKSWEKLEGDPEREPLCRSLLALAIAKLSERNNDMGWCAWSPSRKLLREQDIEDLRVSDISIGEPPEEGAASPVSPELGVLERGETTKRGTSQGVVLLDPEVALFCICKKKSLRSAQRIFSFTIEEYRTAWAAVLKELQFSDLGGPHVLRHTGASHLVQHENWQLPDVQVRGRWGALRSVLHYLQPHLLIKNEQRTPEAWHERARYLWEDPHTHFGLVYALTEVPFEEEIARRNAEPELSQDLLEQRAAYLSLSSPVQPSAPPEEVGAQSSLSDLPYPIRDVSNTQNQ